MVNLPADYSTAKGYDGTGGGNTLPVGGHICKIMDAKVKQTSTGSDMVVLAFDVMEGSEYDGFYRALWERKKNYNPDAKWPGTFRSVVQNREGMTNSYFKGMIAAFEKSNPGFVFNGDEQALRGKLVGFCFGEREFEKSDGSIGVAVEPFYATSIQSVKSGMVSAPERKALKTTRSYKPEPAEEKLPWE